MTQVTWLTSMTEFSPIILPVLEALNPKTICEIGASAGGHSKLLADFLRKKQGKLISIDPMPQQSFIDWARQSSDVVTHVKENSLTGIFRIGLPDTWFIDGDHNWFTVYHELTAIDSLAQKHNQPQIMFLHDVSWPCARRDMYYNPAAIPPEFVHPHSSEFGISLEGLPTAVGLKGPNWALKEGGPKNGILTAVEDFLRDTKTQYHWIHVPAILGLGVLIDARHPLAQQIVQFYAPFHNNPLLATLEKDRITKYLQVCELNEKIAKLSNMLSNLSKACEPA